MGLMGGVGAAGALEAEHTELFAAHHAAAQAALGVTCDLKPTGVAKQVVAGTNFVFSGEHEGKQWTVKIFRPLPHTGAPAEFKEAAFA